MKTRKILANALLATTIMSLSVACSKDDNESSATTGNDQFFISAVTGEANYLLTTEDPSKGSLTTTGNGVELTRSYTWLFHNTDRAMGLIYSQGNPAPGIAYKMNSNGQLVQSGGEFEVPNGYTTYGPFDSYIITAATGRATDTTLAVFNFYDVLNNNARLRQLRRIDMQVQIKKPFFPVLLIWEMALL